MFKLLIFDWDGTIMDSSARIVSSMQTAAKSLELPVPSSSAIENIIGLSLAVANKILIPGISAEDSQRLTDSYSEQYRSLDNTATPLYQDVRETLTNLQAKGYLLAVATGKSRQGVKRVLEQTKLSALFSLYRGADETRSKPDPLMLAEILQQTKVSVEQAIMIGDTSYDLEMAQNIEMASIAVSYGMHSVELLKSFNPVVVVDEFKQIESWLDSQMESESE